VLNYSNGYYSLGGTGRLRGYQPEVFRGPQALVANAEYRTPPFEIVSVQVAGALFYDVGDAFGFQDAQGNFDDLHPRSGAGAGLRLGFPQLQRDVFRIDVGFPLTNSQYGEMTIVAAFGQAI
jgi:outer membrane protein assembly factor BamA